MRLAVFSGQHKDKFEKNVGNQSDFRCNNRLIVWVGLWLVLAVKHPQSTILLSGRHEVYAPNRCSLPVELTRRRNRASHVVSNLTKDFCPRNFCPRTFVIASLDGTPARSVACSRQ